MKVTGVREISWEQSPAELWEWARNSCPLYEGTYRDVPVCYIGLIPRSMMSGTAYIWCHVLADACVPKIIFARWALRLMPQMRAIYPRIIGHCLDSHKWLRSLGATFINEVEFEIG